MLAEHGHAFPRDEGLPQEAMPVGNHGQPALSYVSDILSCVRSHADVLRCWDGKNLDSPNHMDHIVRLRPF